MTDKKEASRAVRKVIVVVKETDYSRADERMKALLARSDRSTAGKLKEHEEHEAAVKVVFDYFLGKGIETERVSVTALPEKFSSGDYIVTVGGDGTYLSSASRALDIPLLGVRSSKKSVGHFALAEASTFAAIMDDILAGKSLPTRLVRMSVALQRFVVEGGTTRTEEVVLEHPVLNEVFVHNNGALASYIVEVGGVSEIQNSSGFFVGTPAGSTGVLRSAGGKHIPVASQLFEYVANLPFVRPGDARYSLLRGTFDASSELSVVSRMSDGKLDIDGKHLVVDFKIGDRVIFRRHKHDLLTWVDPEVNKRYDYFLGIYTPW